MPTDREAYDKLIERTRRAALLGSCSAVLSWDRETCMPPKGAPHRAEQLALLAGMVHEMATAPEIDDLLGQCEGTALMSDALSVEAVNVREIRRRYDKSRKLPRRLVEELARTTSLSHKAWIEARRDAKFELFRPWLEKLIALKREQASAYGYTTVPYDPLLDDFEAYATTAEIASVFSALSRDLVPLIEQVISAPRQPDPELVHRRFPPERQRVFGEMCAAAVGYDFAGGRLDESVHPFTSGFGPGDVRITTRFSADWFNNAFFSIMHEAGHGLHGQGHPAEHFGTPMGASPSMGIGESQSRLWENFVGRCEPFWRHFYPRCQGVFHEALAGVTMQQFLHAVNEVRSSFIRTESDEATYNLHIVLRFELEQAMLSGDLCAADVPAAWNEKFKKLLGISLPSDREGCLQDTHWSFGYFGYFPTYCLGNLYAAQFYAQAKKDLPGLEEGFRRGEFLPLLDWAREKIHRQGKRHRATDLVKVVTGEPLNHRFLIEHLREKYRAMYGF